MVAPHVTSFSRLAAALAVSLLGHGLVLVARLPHSGMVAATPPLQITLPHPPPDAPLVSATTRDALLKNTLDDAAPAPATPSTLTPPPAESTSPRTAGTTTATRAPHAVAAARRKLAKFLIYPPEAIAAGLEGDVQLRLTLDAAGQVVAVDIAVSSGRALLDRAALQAAYVMGGVDAGGRRELLLPVQFRLR